jgi:hypothetical protein
MNLWNYESAVHLQWKYEANYYFSKCINTLLGVHIRYGLCWIDTDQRNVSVEYENSRPIYGRLLQLTTEGIIDFKINLECFSTK